MHARADNTWEDEAWPATATHVVYLLEKPFLLAEKVFKIPDDCKGKQSIGFSRSTHGNYPAKFRKYEPRRYFWNDTDQSFCDDGSTTFKRFQRNDLITR
jgi:hypothetical protein